MLYRASIQRVTRPNVIIRNIRAWSASSSISHVSTRPFLTRTSLLSHINTKAQPPSWQNTYHQIRTCKSDASIKSSEDRISSPSGQGNSAKIPQTPISDNNKPSPTLRIPTSPQPHDTLKTFLKHASQTSISQTSTTYLGTRYEYLVQSHLSSNLSFFLTRTGGRGDFGIDLLGTWDLPRIIARHSPSSSSPSSSRVKDKSPTSPTQQSQQSQQPIKVLIQCKRIRSRPSPNLIRELEGSTRGAPSSFRDEPSLSSSSNHENPTKTLSILVCSRSATKGIREAMGKSPRGMMFACIEELPIDISTSKSPSNSEPESSVENEEEDEEEEEEEEEEERTNPADSNVESQDGNTDIPQTRMRQLLWNRAAAVHCGLEGLDVGTKYVESGNASDTNDKEVVLLWQGRPLDFKVDL